MYGVFSHYTRILAPDVRPSHPKQVPQSNGAGPRLYARLLLIHVAVVGLSVTAVVKIRWAARL